MHTGKRRERAHRPRTGRGCEAGAAAPVRNIRIGHVNLRVADLDRAAAFYRDVLGFVQTADARPAGVPMVTLAADGYHHHIALNTFSSSGGTPPSAEHTGLHHVAFLYADRPALARAVRRLLDHGYPIDAAVDHGGTEAVYLRDPDGNGLELYYDRPRTTWFDAQGRLVIKAEPFDVRELITEQR
jgi:catechol 2,3-dioxygenase